MDKQQKMIDGILDILRRRGAITAEDAAEYKREFEESELDRFEDYLVDEELVEKEDLLAALQEYYDVPSFDVMGVMFDHELVTMFPQDVLVRNCAIPYRHDGPVLIMIVSDPSHDELEVVLREFVSYDIEFYVGIARHIEFMIKDFYQGELYKEDYEDIIDDERRERAVMKTEEEPDGQVHITIEELGEDEE